MPRCDLEMQFPPEGGLEWQFRCKVCGEVVTDDLHEAYRIESEGCGRAVGKADDGSWGYFFFALIAWVVVILAMLVLALTLDRP